MRARVCGPDDERELHTANTCGTAGHARRPDTGLLIVTLVVASLMPTAFLPGLAVGGLLVAGPATLWSWTIQVTATGPCSPPDAAAERCA